MTTVGVQRAIAEGSAQNWDFGLVGGQLGPKTRQQLMQFQQDHRLQATGRLDADTVRALMQ